MDNPVRRRLAGWPAVRRTRRALAERAQARRILASGVFERRWYQAQAGREFEQPIQAVRHYLDQGRVRGLTPSPLFDPAWFDPGRWAAAGRDPLLRYLDGGPGAFGPHPLFDDRAWRRAHPSAGGHPGGAVGHFLATAGPQSSFPARAGHGTWTWGRVQQLLDEAGARWSRDQRLRRSWQGVTWNQHREAAFRRRYGGRVPPAAGEQPLVSVIMVVRRQPSMAVLEAVASVQAQSLTGWELLLVLEGSGAPGSGADDGTLSSGLDQVAAADPRLLRLVCPGPQPLAALRSRGLRAARGRYVAFLDPGHSWTCDHLALSVTSLTERGLTWGHAGLQLLGPGAPRFLAFRGGRGELVHGDHVPVSVLVARRDALAEVGGLDVGLRDAADHDLVLRLAARTPPVLLPYLGAVRRPPADGGPGEARQDGQVSAVLLNRELVDWPALRSGPPPVAGRTSVLLRAAAHPAVVERAVTHLRRTAAGADLEVVVLDDGGSRSHHLALTAAVGTLPGVRLVRTATQVGAVVGLNVAAAAATGDVLLAVHPDVVLDDLWVAPLRAGLQEPAVGLVAPLTRDRDGAVAHAGTGLVPGVDGAAPALTGLPLADAHGCGAADLASVAGPVVGLRAQDWLDAGGLDPALGPDAAWSDLLVRLRGRGRQVARLVPAVQARLVPDLRPDQHPAEPAGRTR